MVRLRWLAVIGMVACLAFGSGESPGAVASSPAASSLDLKVALRGEAKCGRFSDHLPTLLTVAGLQPGERTPSVVVCLRNAGGNQGQLAVGVLDLSTVDPVCSPGETAVDVSCGQGLAGELQDGLVQETASLRRCQDLPRQFQSAAFASLVAEPVPIGPIGANETRCVAVRVAYRTGTPEAEASAQTDTITWRYAFDLTR